LSEEGDESAKEKASIKKPPGCVIWLTLIGVALLGFGIYLTGRWNSLPAAARGPAIVLIVLGSLALLPVILIYGVVFAVKVIVWKFTKDISGAAKGILDINKAMYSEIHEYRPAEDEDFEGLDRSFYDGTRDLLAAQGFTHLGDIVDATIEEKTDHATPIRVLNAPGGTTQASLYHFKLPKMHGPLGDTPRLMIDVTTEFSDGSFLMTSNTQGSDLMTPPPLITRKHFPLGTPVTDVIAAHEAEKQTILASKPGVTAVVMTTIEQVITSEKRQQAIKNAFRQGIGFADPEEVKRITSEIPDAGDIPDELSKAVDDARKREQS